MIRSTAFSVLVWLISGASSLQANLSSPKQEEPDPVAFRENSVRQNGLLTTSGEWFCWRAAFSAEDFLTAYLAYKNVAWLVEAEKYYDFCVSKLAKDPDGWEGWIGPPQDDTPGIAVDAMVGDAILCATLLRFAEIVSRDPALKTRFGQKADAWIKLSTRMCWEKWNRRGCYYEDGGLGSYHGYPRAIDPKTGQWMERPSLGLGDPLNKNYVIAIAILRLWRVTGREEYRERVEKIFARAKAVWRYFADEDRVVWSYWIPHAPFDLEGRAPKHFVGVHPNGGYQAGEVSAFVEVYDSGLVFEQIDLERIIRTNHWMIQDRSEGKYRAADGSSENGALWTALDRFDLGIRKAHEANLNGKTNARDQITYAYLKNVTEKELGWKRLFVTDPARVKVVRPPLQAGRTMSMAFVIPQTVETADHGRTKLSALALVKGKMKIELLDAAGKDVLGVLWEEEVSPWEFVAPRWDGTHPKSGRKETAEYRIRFSLGGESRTEPVRVRPGTKHPETGPATLGKGETVTVDFEKPLDPRWKTEGAKLSDEQPHGGKKSLKLVSGDSALLVFGKEEDLPVKVTMWVFDAGQKLGKKTANGPAWGITTADGDQFCVRTCWRSYLDGDGQYAWVNTGEAHWNSNYPAGVNRKSGWHSWIFDFSNPKEPRIECEGDVVGGVKKKYTPSGCVGVFFTGGDEAAGPFYVDDITIEYPKK
jgi:hypothetical protein